MRTFQEWGDNYNSAAIRQSFVRKTLEVAREVMSILDNDASVIPTQEIEQAHKALSELRNRLFQSREVV